MRVSKDVRNFIGEQVREIFKKDDQAQQEYQDKEKQAKELIEEYNNAIVEYLKVIKNDLNEELKALGFEAYITTKWSDKNNLGCSVNSYCLDHCSETYKQQRQIETERQEKITKAIQDIIITLELGGNKQDLMNMLEKLKEDNK